MTKNNATCKVLIIEDEAPIRMSIVAYLNDFGYQTFEAENGRIGLEVFRREAPDLVLLDLRMPVRVQFTIIKADEIILP